MKFGVREICDVTFKAAANNQKVGNKVFKKYQPVFMIDTARTSNFEQASTTVYAQGGRGYARLIAWEGEKTMTFTVEDALISPMGLAVLSGAGLINHEVGESARVHVTLEKSVGAAGDIEIELNDLREELGLDSATSFVICDCIPMYATVIGATGKAEDFLEVDEISAPVTVDAANPATLTVNASAAGKTVVVDFYLAMTNSVQTITIGPEDFGGFYYVEAQTLFRDEATGKDLAANITFPRVKIQSGFTFTMAASGDPSTFNFVMDAFPGYTIARCDKRTMCDIQILSISSSEDDQCLDCDTTKPETETPQYDFESSVSVIAKTAPGLTIDMRENQEKASITVSREGSKDTINLTIAGGVDSLNDVEPVAGWGLEKWVALDYNTGEDSIVGMSYTNRGTTVTLGADDVADAAELGLGAGHLLVWTKANLDADFSLAKGAKAISVHINKAV